MALKLNSASGSITISPEDGSGNANVTFPRAGYAGLDSPALTGTPTAPTATAGTSTTQLATTAFVAGEVAGIVDAAPATLDTLNELAAALGDDANFSTTVTNSIATKLPLAGGTMTGNLDLGDNVKARFGAGPDLEIYSDGNNGIIADITGTGNLVMRGGNFNVENAAGTQNMLTAVDGGAVILYHNNGQKVQTTSTGADITGTLSANAVTVNGALDIEEVKEFVDTSTSTSGLINYNLSEYAIHNFTANQTANRTINFRGDGSNTLNSILSTNQSMTCTVLMAQGSTAYYLNAYQVDGTAVTPKWSGGSAPTAGNASGIDVYTFTIIKTADATFTVLASQTQYA
jgi:hypothetical protein